MTQHHEPTRQTAWHTVVPDHVAIALALLRKHDEDHLGEDLAVQALVHAVLEVASALREGL